MQIKVSRNSLIWGGVLIISLYYFLNKYEFIRKAEFTTGKALYYTSGLMQQVRVEFSTDTAYYSFEAEPNVSYKQGELLPVIYLKSNPQKAHVYNFLGFWYTGLIYCLVPLFIWCALLLSWFETNEIITLSYLLNKLRKKEIVNQPTESKTLSDGSRSS